MRLKKTPKVALSYLGISMGPLWPWLYSVEYNPFLSLQVSFAGEICLAGDLSPFGDFI